MNSAKLYVCNVPWTSTEEDLKGHFEQVGEVKSAVIIKDRETGRSRGFGFVEMGNIESAEKAISEFNGKEFAGRPLKVLEAIEREKREPRKSYGESEGGYGQSYGQNSYGRR